jgi:hypothetical protein
MIEEETCPLDIKIGDLLLVMNYGFGSGVNGDVGDAALGDMTINKLIDV